MLAGPDGFFPALLRHRVRPSYGTFINGFAKKKLVVPYGSYDKICSFMICVMKQLFWSCIFEQDVG